MNWFANGNNSSILIHEMSGMFAGFCGSHAHLIVVFGRCLWICVCATIPFDGFQLNCGIPLIESLWCFGHSFIVVVVVFFFIFIKSVWAWLSMVYFYFYSHCWCIQYYDHLMLIDLSDQNYVTNNTDQAITCDHLIWWCSTQYGNTSNNDLEAAHAFYVGYRILHTQEFRTVKCFYIFAAIFR